MYQTFISCIKLVCLDKHVQWGESIHKSSSQVKSSQVKSSQVKSSQVKSSQVKSSQVKSSQVKSSQVKSGAENKLETSRSLY